MGNEGASFKLAGCVFLIRLKCGPDGHAVRLPVSSCGLTSFFSLFSLTTLSWTTSSSGLEQIHNEIN